MKLTATLIKSTVVAALGGLLTYQAGMLNIALDGFMIVAAFTECVMPTSSA